MQFRGTLVALVTPFKDGVLDTMTLQRLISHQLDEGTDGLVLCGTTGESPTLSEHERGTIIETATRLAQNRCPVIVGTGTNATETTLKYSRQAQELGADAVMVVAPYYNKPPQHGLYQHFATVAREISLPIILYNIPGRCGVEIAEQTLCTLAGEYKNIVAVKHATGSVAGAASLHAASKLDILSGDDPLTLPLMSVGAVGVISVLANLLPGKLKKMTDAFLTGDMHTARRIHEELYPLASGLLSLDTNPLPIKTALAFAGMMREEFRLPLCCMSEECRERLKQLLIQSGIL